MFAASDNNEIILNDNNKFIEFKYVLCFNLNIIKKIPKNLFKQDTNFQTANMGYQIEVLKNKIK